MKPYSKLSPDELREYHRAAWRRYYHRNPRRFIEKSLRYFANHPEQTRMINNKATRKYKDKTRFNGRREMVLKRDNYQCCFCGKNNQLIIHHKDEISYHNSPQPNSKLSNLITLCRSCHTRLHHLLRRSQGGRH